MSKTSRYDTLHDKYSQLASSKDGTRYERLAALVLKSLNDVNVVIHDLKLRGESDVPHQIDVSIDVDGKPKNVIVECKDHDVSGSKVGLNVIRSFDSIVKDTLADEAMVITCNGFTKNARKYAKHKGIKLVIIRSTEHPDEPPLINKIYVNITIVTKSEPNVRLGFADEESIGKFTNDMQAARIGMPIPKGSPVFLHSGESRVLFHEYLDSLINKNEENEPGMVDLEVDTEGLTIEVEERGALPLGTMKVSYEVYHSIESINITSNKIAELIVRGFGDDDLIVFDEDLKRFQIDSESGEVTESVE